MVKLTEIKKNYKVVINNVNLDDKKLLNYLESLGFVSGITLKVLDYSILKKNLLVELIGAMYVIDYNVAKNIWVDYEKDSFSR